jgi:ubiquinone/menaquinone biosynthesis C-methylase UbiE
MKGVKKVTEHQEHEWDRQEAEHYARWGKLASRFFYAPSARRIVEHVAPAGDDLTIIDLWAGPGILSMELSKLLPQAKIIGVDPSADMLDIARQNAGEAGISAYETRLGRAEEIPAESDSIDLVVSQLSLHEWEDPPRGLREIFRVLKPGGSFIVRDFNRDWLSTWKAGLVKFLSTVIRESYENHLKMFRFDIEDVLGLLREAGFGHVQGNGRGLLLFAHASKADGSQQKAVRPDSVQGSMSRAVRAGH